MMNHAQMVAVINGGGIVFYRDRQIRTIEDLPSDEQIAADNAADVATGDTASATTLKTGDIEIGAVEIKDAATGNRVHVNADGQLAVDVGGLDINPGDINIGAIEIKDDTADTRANVKTDGTNNALVVVQNIQPLPAGASTSAKQDTANTSLAAIKVGTDKIIAAPATEAKQDTGNTSLASILTALATLLTQTDAIESPLATIAGKDFATQTTLAALLTAAATAAKQDTGNTSLASIVAALATLLTQTDGVEGSLSSLDSKLPALSGGRLPVVSAPPFGTRSDTYAATGNGVTVNVSAAPLKQFAVSVKGTGGAATAWDVRLEGSLDGTNWTQIIQHTNTLDSDGSTKPQLAGIATPLLFFRSRCAGLTLGVSATDVVVTILGM